MLLAATHAAAVTTPALSPESAKRCRINPPEASPTPSPGPPSSEPLPLTPEPQRRARKGKKKRYALLVRTWLPGRIRYVRMRGERCQFRGYRRLGTCKWDHDEETKTSAFNDIAFSEDDPKFARPDYRSLQAALAAFAMEQTPVSPSLLLHDMGRLIPQLSLPMR